MEQIEKRLTIFQFLKNDSETCIIGVGKFNIPIVACWRIDFYHVAFFCPDCKIIHRHGFGNGKPDGHRASHCHGNAQSRFYSSGYYLCCQGSLWEEEKW